MPDPDAPAPRWRQRALLAALVVVASWPYVGVLGLWPMATDTGLWLERGDPASAGWVEWVFGTQHFGVGYRPLTALSFTLNAWIDPASTLLLRSTDLGLHGALALLVAALARQLAPELGWRAGVSAALLYLVHPALEEVVPYGARRSYTLAGVCALGGLVLACRVARGGGGPGRRVLASLPVGLLLALALLSNEVAGVAIGALPLLVLAAHRPGRGRWAGAAASCVLPALLVGAALVARQSVVEGLGGYRVEGDGAARFGAILARSWRDVLGPGYARGWLGSSAACAAAAALLVLAHAGAVLAPARAPRATRALRAAALVAWLATYGLLFAGQGVWFARQGFPIVVPLALLGGLHLAQALAARRGRAALLALLLLGTLPVLLTSPVLRGPDAERRAEWALRQALIDGLLAAARGAEEGARIKAVLPFRADDAPELKALVAQQRLPRDARQPIKWVQYLLRDAVTDVQEFLYVEEPSLDWSTPCAVTTDGGKPAVRVPAERATLLFRHGLARARKPRDGLVQRLDLDALELRRTIYVYVYDRDGGTSTRVHR
jgi:hypothetical protein